MKVLHIIWNAKFGGIEKIVYELAEEQLISSEVTPAVLIAKEEGEFLVKFREAEFSSYFLNFKKGLDLKFSNFKNALGLFQKYDVLHLHFFNPILALAAYLSKKKIVYTEHGNFGFGRKEKKSDRLLNALKKRFLNYSMVSITYNSNFTRQYSERHLGLFNHPRSSVVTNGINLLVYFNTKELGPQQKEFQLLKEQLKDKFVIGTSSRFAGFKRIDRLIDAFNKIPKNDQTILLLVGDGVLMPVLKKQVEALNLQHQVIFTGFVDKIRYYQDLMDVCVFPSESEPFGLVAVETLSLGKPTIVFQSGGGLVEIVEGINMKDVVADESHLVERMEYYRRHREEIELSKKTRIEYSKGFSISSVVDELVPIYQKKQ
ncbi:MAG: glycosyltransferase family 4 protein [Flavobacteriales bacterium]|nr:glycosyltransferase family 4 protein [Flavobacteriales bacterium]